jgi:hypothetical protein
MTRLLYFLILFLFPLGAFAADIGMICVSRPENNGAINIYPVKIIRNGQELFTLAGGETKCEQLQAGEHKIIASSPNPFDPNDKNNGRWQSRLLKASVLSGKVSLISVEPVSRHATYIGPWKLKILDSIEINPTDKSGEFWMNWWVNLSVAVATFAAVLIALFGDWFRARIFSPKLKLQLRNSHGEATVVRMQWQDETGIHETRDAARYYHVRVLNEKRWPAANQVQVHLVRVEELGADGLQVTWSGEMPIQWMHQAIYPLARTIGASAYCDLCSVVKDKWIRLHPVVSPHNLSVERPGPVSLIISLQARGNEAESGISRFQIQWDGKWADDDQQMMNHFVVKDITGS